MCSHLTEPHSISRFPNDRTTQLGHLDSGIEPEDLQRPVVRPEEGAQEEFRPSRHRPAAGVPLPQQERVPVGGGPPAADDEALLVEEEAEGGSAES